jgi:N-acyl-D-aspartate/D-glutamate deacylase
MADLVIRDATICDGTGAPAHRGDLAVTGGTITAVGGRAERGTAEVDAGGLALAPGFIDLHTHYDCQLFWDPHATPSPWHGVTTVVMGNCGFTIAPCRPADRETLMRLLLFVEGMPIETLRAGIPWTWEDYPGYLAALERNGLGVNVVSFIGHSAIRLQVMGAAALERAATADERAAMAALVRQGMAVGAIGWSTSLSPTHFFGDTGDPAPSRMADRDELLALASALRDLDRGVIEIAPGSTIGSAEDRLAEVDRYADMARASGKLVSFAPLFDSPFAPGVSQKIMAMVASLQREGVQVVPQVGCRPLELRFDFAAPAFGLENNPFWKPFMALPRAERARRFADPAFRSELRGLSERFVLALAPNWEQLFLRVAAGDRHRALQDQSVGKLAAARGQDPVDAFCDLVLEENLETQWGAIVMNAEGQGVADLIRNPAAMLALSDAGAHVDSLCDQGFTTWLLGKWVRERGVIGLEDAVRMITSVPADRYGLAGRGRLAPGNAADLVLFDPARVGTRSTELVHDLPGGQRRLLQRADGVEYVFVNGQAVVERGTPVDHRPGRVLRGGH